MGLIQNIFRGMKKQEDREDLSDEVEDRGLTHLRREWDYYKKKEEKEYLENKLREYKKKKMREQLYGIKKSKQEKSILGIEKKPSKIMNNSCSIIRK